MHTCGEKCCIDGEDPPFRSKPDEYLDDRCKDFIPEACDGFEQYENILHVFDKDDTVEG